MIIHLILGIFCLAAFVFLVMKNSAFGSVMLALAILNFVVAVREARKKDETVQEKIVVTSTPPQIDTTITVRNGVADTTYTYHFPPEGRVN